jgi:NAD(P)-dependent dehydrogenase (short-subunit alcohol dehydrogenase family)
MHDKRAIDPKLWQEVVVSQKELSGKSIVITGAGQGIGAAYAHLCGALGANVVVVDVNPDTAAQVSSEIVSAGGQSIAQVRDVGDSASMNDLASVCVSQFGGLDGWVNNAALYLSEKLEESDPEKIERMVHVNVLGVIYGTQAAARVMIRQGSGSIVNVTSGSQSGMRHNTVYGATKGAVASLTYGAALDMAEDGIRVNAISPTAATQMVAEHDTHWAKFGLAPTIQAMPTADNNAAAVAYLLSDRAEDVSGQVVRVDTAGLSIVGRPAVIQGATVEGSDWTFGGVIEAFDKSLRAYLVKA